MIGLHGFGWVVLVDTGRKRRLRAAGKDHHRTDGDPPGDGGPDEAAAFIAEAVSDLSRLAGRHRLDVLSHLLAMAQLEAEDHLRLRSRRKLS